MPDLRLVRSVWDLGDRLAAGPEATLAAVRAAGFSAVEGSTAELLPLAPHLRAAGLAVVPSVWSSWAQYAGPWVRLSVEEHLAAFRAELAGVAGLAAAAVSVLKVNAHSGCDSWTEDECVAFFQGAVAAEAEAALGVPVLHETHRGRALHNAHLTDRVLARVPGLLLTGDISHFHVVHERLFGRSPGETAVFRRIADRTRHVHARVGTPQSPQVPTPATADRETNAAHTDFWAVVFQGALDRAEEATATLEYGPPPYCPTGPGGLPHVPLEEAIEAGCAQVREVWDALGHGPKGV